MNCRNTVPKQVVHSQYMENIRTWNDVRSAVSVCVPGYAKKIYLISECNTFVSRTVNTSVKESNVYFHHDNMIA